jgi:hypothetical protein
MVNMDVPVNPVGSSYNMIKSGIQPPDFHLVSRDLDVSRIEISDSSGERIFQYIGKVQGIGVEGIGNAMASSLLFKLYGPVIEPVARESVGVFHLGYKLRKYMERKGNWRWNNITMRKWKKRIY